MRHIVERVRVEEPCIHELGIRPIVGVLRRGRSWARAPLVLFELCEQYQPKLLQSLHHNYHHHHCWSNQLQSKWETKRRQKPLLSLSLSMLLWNSHHHFRYGMSLGYSSFHIILTLPQFLCQRPCMTFFFCWINESFGIFASLNRRNRRKIFPSSVPHIRQDSGVRCEEELNKAYYWHHNHT